MDKIKIIECPRDAMQGLSHFIPTETKVEYIDLLLKCGFDVLDMGSFVSPKAIPQMKDTADVLDRISLNGSSTKLLSIIANKRGAEAAVCYDQITYLGFPFSISETFQQRNTNKSMEESFLLLEDIFSIASARNKEVVLYLSMGFGNPYGDDWSDEILFHWTKRLNDSFGASIIALSDTIGCADSKILPDLYKNLIASFPEVEFGAHLHVNPFHAQELISASYEGGCKRFDTAMKGFGGCPMAKDDLTGNLPTEELIKWINKNNMKNNLDQNAVSLVMNTVSKVFESTQ
ncbi:MAG: hydroxymethylglutaryl-CoA lyase [Crocinitomicaceae bacterium]|nr:hydroxymethylglutaryl-CoA lyase [Crocinitomicaceae bacterium]